MTRLTVQTKAGNSSTSALALVKECDIVCAIRRRVESGIKSLLRVVNKEQHSNKFRTAPVGGIFYYELKYGNTKGTVTAGDLLVQDFNAYYSSQTIDSEIIGTGPGTTFSSTLDYTVVKTDTVKVYANVSGTAVSGVDDGEGVISGTGVSGTIDYDDGTISVSFSGAATGSITCQYEYNMECNTNIPQVNIDISLVEIRATTRKLKALWCSEA